MLELVYREHELLIYKVDIYRGKKKQIRSLKDYKLLKGS